MKNVAVLVVLLLVLTSCENEVYNGENLFGLWYIDYGAAYDRKSWKVPVLISDEDSKVTMVQCDSWDSMPHTFTNTGSTLEGDSVYYSISIASKSKMTMHLENDDGPDDFDIKKISDETEFNFGKLQFESELTGNVDINSNVCSYSINVSGTRIITAHTFYDEKLLSLQLRFPDVNSVDIDVDSEDAFILFGSGHYEREYGYDYIEIPDGTIRINELTDNYVNAEFNGTWLKEGNLVSGSVEVEFF